MLSPARAVLFSWTTLALAGCAIPLPTQKLEVLVQADDPAWNGPLACKAANSFGEWPFTAPGPLFLRASTSPLRISCSLPAGALVEESIISSRSSDVTRESARKGASTGAKVGGGVGAVLGVAAAPLMGPAFAVLLVAGGALRGAEIGGVLAAASAGPSVAYPSPIVLHIKMLAPEPGAQPAVPQ